MKKYLITVLVGVVFLGGVAAYVARHAPEGGQTADVPPLKVGLLVYPGYAPFYIAQAQGFYKKHGVRVEMAQIGVDNVFPALQSGEIDMLGGTSDMAAVVADAGIEAKQIFASSKSNGADGLLVHNSIQSVEDLKGKKVHVAFGFPDHFLFRNIMRQAGLAAQDVELVNLDPEAAGAAFAAGKLDAAWTWEPFLSKANQRPDGHILITSREVQELMAEDVIFARTEVIANRREEVKRMMRAFFDAVAWWQENESAGDEIVAKAFGIPPAEVAAVRATIVLADLEINLQKFDATKPWNVFEQATRAGEVYFEDGVIKTKPSGAAVTDATLLSELK